MRVPRRVPPLLLGGLGIVGLLFPAGALGHGLVGKADLPIPVWLFSWAAAIVLVVSFVALSALWRSPQLQERQGRALLRVPRGLGRLVQAIGLALFALLLYSGFAGAQVPSANFAVTFVYVIFWVGLPVVSVLCGDVFRLLSPWRTCAGALAAGLARIRGPERAATPLLRYPAWLGDWPAVAGLLGFAWLELVYVNRDRPSLLAALSLLYFLAMLAGMLAFGVEQWSARADGFGVYLNLLSRLSPLHWAAEGTLCLRRPLSGVTDLPTRRGTVALICTILGSTTFDGLSNGALWRNLEPSIQSLFADLGLHQTLAQELAYSVGLLLCAGLIALVYRAGILGVRSVSDRYEAGQLTRTFAHTLAPIAFAYVLAHYFSLLLWQGQAMGYLISDPLGEGSNLFGSAGYEIDYQVLSYAGIWYVQVAALLAGHVGGLALAHDRALVLYRDRQEAVRGQYWLLAVMVAFTSFGLWLLSSVGT